MFGAMRARTPKGRGKSSNQEPEGEGRVLRVQEHLVLHVELHVPPGGVELCLAPVLPLLQQRPHLHRHAPHETGSVLARTRWVRDRDAGGKRAEGVLAAVGEEEHVTTPEGRRGIVDRELDQRHEALPVVGTLAGD